MSDTILIDYKNTSEHFLRVLSSFTAEQFNMVPFEGSWTAAQVGDHIAKSQSMVAQLFYVNTRTSERNPLKNVETIKKVFLNFDTKLTSPESILPSVERMDKVVVINNLINITGKVTEAIHTVDLSKICTEFVPPNLGELTVLEWVYFMIYHTQRHTNQLNNIFQKVAVG